MNNRGELPESVMKAVNEQLMPLVDECIDMAYERAPQLEGMLALSMHAVGDPDLGSVIDAVEVGARNEVLELELLECVRESAWTLKLPPPEEAGAHAFELTLPLGSKGAD